MCGRYPNLDRTIRTVAALSIERLAVPQVLECLGALDSRNRQAINRASGSGFSKHRTRVESACSGAGLAGAGCLRVDSGYRGVRGDREDRAP